MCFMKYEACCVGLFVKYLTELSFKKKKHTHKKKEEKKRFVV